ncbi:hypothetical protein Btru_060541 [Bulinus truncatus]|nr:hypothetical protein Btru_060541 [Bulinus truncatus]
MGKSHGSKLKPKIERNMGADDDSLSEPIADRTDQENNVIAFDDEVKGSKFDTENNLLLLEHIYKVLSVLRSLNSLRCGSSEKNLNLLSDYTSEHRQKLKKSEDDETLKELQSSNTSPLSQFNDKINKCIENLQDLHQQFYSDQSYDTERRGRTGTKKRCSFAPGGSPTCKVDKSISCQAWLLRECHVRLDCYVNVQSGYGVISYVQSGYGVISYVQSDCGVVKLSDCGVVKLSECGVVKLSDCGVIKLSDCGVVKLSLFGVVKLSHCSVIKLSDCGVVKLSQCGVVKLSDCGVVKLSDCGVVKLSQCGVVKLSDCGVVKLSDCGVVKLSQCGVVKLSDCGVVKLSHCGVIQLSDCGVVKLSHCGVVKLSDCGVVKLSDCGVVKLSHCGVVKLSQCGVVKL